MTQFRIFWDLLITFEGIELYASNLVDIEDGLLLHVDHKTTLSGRGPGHVTLFSNIGTLISFERIELSASNLVHI